MERRKSPKYPKNGLKHRRWQVTLIYQDGERFARVYTDRNKAAGFADRQKKSPVVKMARVIEIS